MSDTDIQPEEPVPEKPADDTPPLPANVTHVAKTQEEEEAEAKEAEAEADSAAEPEVTEEE